MKRTVNAILLGLFAVSVVIVATGLWLGAVVLTWLSPEWLTNNR